MSDRPKLTCGDRDEASLSISSTSSPIQDDCLSILSITSRHNGIDIHAVLAHTAITKLFLLCPLMKRG